MINKSYMQTRIGKAIAGITGIMFLFYMISCGSVDTASPSSKAVGLITSLTLSEVSENSITLDWDLLKTKEGMADPDITYTVYVETNNGEGVFTKDSNTEKVYTLAAENPLTVDDTQTRAIVVVEGLAKGTPYRIVVEVRDASGNTGRAEPLAYTASTLTDFDISGLEASNFIDSDEVMITWDTKEEAQFYLIQASEKQLGESELVDNVLAVVCPPDSLLCERRDQFAESWEDGKLGYVLQVNKKEKYKLVVVPFNFQDLSDFQVIDKGVMRTFTEEVLVRVEDENSVLSRRLQAALDNHAQEVQIKVSKAGSPKDLVLTSTGYTLSATWGHGIGAEYYYASLTVGEVAVTNIINRYDPSGKFAESGFISFYDLIPETSYTVRVQSFTVIDGKINPGGSVSSPQRTREAGDVLDTIAPSTVGDLFFSEHAERSFKVTWARPDDAGRGISNTSVQLAGYRVSWGTNTEVLEKTFDISNPNILFYTIPRLTPGTQYYVRVQAKNDNQEGNIYNAGSIGSTYTIKVPGTVSTITYSNHTTNSFKVNWDAVTNTGYVPKGPLASVGYRLDYRMPGEDWQSVPRSDYSATEETLTGLASGTNYQVRVVATNEASLDGTAGIGGKTWTLSSPEEVGGLVVSAPHYNEIDHTGSFKVSWTAPQDTGRTSAGGFAAITGYEVIYFEVNGTGTNSVSLSSVRTEHVFTGLKPKQEYHIRVQAKNENGIGKESQVSGWVPSLPGAVGRNSITLSAPTSRTIQIRWNAPEPGRVGGSSPSNTTTLYKVEMFLAGDNNNYTLVQDNYSSTTITATGLAASTTYHARITAKNVHGETTATESISIATTLDEVAYPPSKVEDLTVKSSSDSEVVLSWSKPTNMGTIDGYTPANLINYEVKYKKTTDSQFIYIYKYRDPERVRLSQAWQETNTTATVLGLSNNTSYTFLVVAVNSGINVYPGITTTPDKDGATVVHTTRIPAPKNFAKNSTTCEESNKVDLTWDAVPRATYYNLRRGTTRIGGNINTTNYTDTGLSAGKSYTYKVQACNSAGCSIDSEPLTITTLKTMNLRTLIEGKKLPNDPLIYDQRTQEILFRYRYSEGIYRQGRPLVAKHLRVGGAGTKDGSSYANASGDLKSVMDGITDAAADKVYLVLLDGGTYPITQTINMKNNVAIVGGVNKCLDFTDTETILDGGNEHRVIHNRDLNDSALLYGVTIANGKARNGNFLDDGGGMVNNNSSPSLVGVTFTGNEARNGGAVYNFNNSSPVFIKATFSGNTATDDGGGMYNKDSSPTLINVTFLDRMYNDNNSKDGPLVVNSILSGGRGIMNNNIINGDASGNVENFQVYYSAVSTGNLVSGEKRTSQFNEGWFRSILGERLSPAVIRFSDNISDDPQLDTSLRYHRGLVKTHSIPKTSPLVDKGIFVRMDDNGKFYYSKEDTMWYSNPDLTGDLSTLNAVRFTTIDVTGYTRTGRPDIGAYEARQGLVY